MKTFTERQEELAREAAAYIKAQLGEDEHGFYIGRYRTSISAQASPDVLEDMFYIDWIDGDLAGCHESGCEDEITVDVDNLSTDTLVYIADQIALGNVRNLNS